MKCQPILKEINILTRQIKSRNPTLIKVNHFSKAQVLKSMGDEITYLSTKDQDDIPKYHIENILKSYTQADALYVIVFFQHLQSLGVLKNQFQNQLLEFIESLTIVEEIELKVQQILMTLINQDISLSNLVYSIRCLRQCEKLYNSTNKIVKLSIITQMDQIISLLGKSARSLLCNSEQEDPEKQSNLELSLQNFIILFSSIIDGEKDLDFDVTFALKSLNSFFLELNQLLILLDPNVVNIIKSNLSRQLKALLSQTIAPINQQLQTFRCVETLLIGNPIKFCDFLTVISQHIASEQHSSQKALSYKVIMVCAKHGVFRECLQNDQLKQEITQFYSTVTDQSKIENFVDNTNKLRQIQEVIGNIVSLESMFNGVSDNEFVIDSIVQFNLNLSESLFQSDIKLPIILQNSIKKCHKHLIKTIQPTRLLRSFFYFCCVLDFQLREDMLDILLKQEPNIEITKIIVEIIYQQKGNFSYKIWLQTLELFFQLDMESEYRQEFKGLFLHNFENIVEQTILFSLVSCSFVQQSMQLLILIMSKHFQRIRFLWQSILDKLIKKLKETNQLEYIETICSLLIVRFEKCQQFDQEILLSLVELQNDTVTQVILSNVITICSRYDIENIDILLGLLLKCKQSEKVLITMFEIIKNRNLLEQSWDIILQIIKIQHQSSTDIDLVMGKLYQKIVDNEQYAIAFFQLAVTVQCSIEILFQILNSMTDQVYSNKQLNLELFQFLIQSKLRYNDEFAIELCKWTFKVKDQEIISQQYNYLQQALEFENESLVIEITRIIRFYLQEYPQEMSLASIVESYDFLYSTNHPKLTKCLCIIIDDLLDILGVFFRISQQNIKTLFCLYGKLIQLRLYPDFEECIIQNKFTHQLDKIFTLFKLIHYRTISSQDNYYNQQYQQLQRRLINLKQTTTEAIDIVRQTLQYVDKETAYTILDFSIPEIQECIRKQFSDQ